MKNVFTFLMCTLCIFTGIAQSDLTMSNLVISERTPELQALYEQSVILESTGTAAEINANRLAIKNAWQKIDPEIAALYKPLETSNIGLGGEKNNSSNTIKKRPEPTNTPEDWTTDIFLRDSYIDGLDMDVTLDGDIYIAAFENFTGGGSQASIYIYRSTDGGYTFSLWTELPGINFFISKIQTISMDGAGTEYLLLYTLFDNGNLQALRWDIATAAFDFQHMVSDITDFGVDRNFPPNTNSQRCFVTYQKTTTCSEVFSARSTAGSYGFDWVDETSLGICGNQIEYAYGLNGGTYTTFTGATSGNLYGMANPSYNDPASWQPVETVVDGSITETLNPTIRATRKEFTADEVLIIASSRAAGSSDVYIGQAYQRQSGSAYTPLTYITAAPSASIMQIDSWTRKIADNEIIQTSYVRDHIDINQNDVNRSKQYDGNTFAGFEPVSDSSLNVYNGFPSAVAETSDGLPCVAFTGTDSGFGYGLYFDAKSTLDTENAVFENFKLYPNPSKDILNLSAKNTIENVSIYSLLGQKVLETKPDQDATTINIAHLAPGMYILKLAIQDKTASYKFIKQ